MRWWDLALRGFLLLLAGCAAGDFAPWVDGGMRVVCSSDAQ